MYPPDPSGRRPSQHTQLQYANPAQRQAHERFVPTGSAQAGYSYHSYQPTPSYISPPYNPVNPLRTTDNHTAAARRAEPTIITRAGDNTSSGSSSGGGQRPHTEPTITRYWFCCTPGCPNNGPYIEGLYEVCYGCERPKCLGCRREIVSLRDRPPVENQSSRPKRRP